MRTAAEDDGPWLIDKSALVRLDGSPDADEWANRIDRGLVRISTPTLLEVGYSSRSGADLAGALHEPLLSRMPREYLTPRMEDRALAVLSLLGAGGQHRAVSAADLLVASIAETRRLTVLHVDKDFDLIAGVTRQPVERLSIQ